jgi:hypothetical protein
VKHSHPLCEKGEEGTGLSGGGTEMGRAMAFIWLGAHCAQLREIRETFGCAYLQA